MEYIGVKDPIGNGLCNMYLTEEEIIRYRDCGHHRGTIDSMDCVENGCFRRKTDPNGFCHRAVREDEQ